MPNRKQALVFIAMVTVYYFFVIWFSGFFSNTQVTYTLSPDTLEYLSVRDWLLGQGPTEFLGRRNFFYPAFLAFFAWAGIADWLWLVQGAFWIVSTCLFAASIWTVTKRTWLRLFATALFMLNWTMILLSVLALTESLVLLLFSAMTFVLVRGYARWPLIIVGLMGIAIVTKPNYLPIYGALTLWVWLLSALGRLRVSAAALAVATVLSLLPMGIQAYLNTRNGAPPSEPISRFVLRAYFYPQVFARVTGQDLEVVQREMMAKPPPPDSSEAVSYLLAHPGAVMASYFKNLEQNFREVFYIDGNPHPVENFWRKQVTNIYYWLQVVCILPLLFGLWRSRHWNEPAHFQLWALSAIFVICLLASSLVYWAGGRMMAPVTGVWMTAYAVLFQLLRPT